MTGNHVQSAGTMVRGVPQSFLQTIWDFERSAWALADLAAEAPEEAEDDHLRCIESAVDESPGGLDEEISEVLERFHSLRDEVIDGAGSEGGARLGAVQQLLSILGSLSQQVAHLEVAGHRRRRRRIEAFLRWCRGNGPSEFARTVRSLQESRTTLAAAAIADGAGSKRKSSGQNGRGHQRRGCRLRYKPEADKELVSDWGRAKETGVSRQQFTQDKSMTVSDLMRAQARCRKRDSGERTK